MRDLALTTAVVGAGRPGGILSHVRLWTRRAKPLGSRRPPGVLNLAIKHLHEGSYGLIIGRVQEMITAGWEVDSHTINHVDVTTLAATRLTHEIAGSRKILRGLFNQPVDFFCYPSGAYDATAITAVRAVGYLGATTTNEGIASPHQNPYELDRIRIHANETPAALAPTLKTAH